MAQAGRIVIALEWIKPGQIREVWETILPGLKKVEATTDAWITEEVYHLILMAAVSLHIVKCNDEYKGFIITQKIDFCGGITLHVFCAYSKAHDFDVLEHSTEEIISWAKNIEARKITFSTTRQGWEKVAPKLGFKKSLVTYELQV